MPRYLHADSNLHSHIKSLRLISGILAASLVVSMFGWHYATRVQRVSLPPDLRYGSQILLNRIHPWEVFNFAGYIWQQLNRCQIDCFEDYPKNLDRLSAFITPAFKAWLKHDSEKRSTEFLGRTRYILPLLEADFNGSVMQEDSDSWTVVMEVELREDIGGVPVKNVQIRYYLRVIKRQIDPEFNPWGLLLDTMPRMPERISVEQT